jgi:hypothetical protein
LDAEIDQISTPVLPGVKLKATEVKVEQPEAEKTEADNIF